MPFFQEKPCIGGNIGLNKLAGINAKAQNPDDAWEFIKFMNGEKSAKFKSRSTYEMSSLTSFVKIKEGMDPVNIDAFTKVKPVPVSQSALKDQELFRTKPNLNMVNELGNQAYMKVIQGTKTVKEALEEWQNRGNDLLQKIKTNPDGPIEGIYEDGGGGAIPFEKMELMKAAGEIVESDSAESSETVTEEAPADDSAASDATEASGSASASSEAVQVVE